MYKFTEIAQSRSYFIETTGLGNEIQYWDRESLEDYILEFFPNSLYNLDCSGSASEWDARESNWDFLSWVPSDLTVEQEVERLKLIMKYRVKHPAHSIPNEYWVPWIDTSCGVLHIGFKAMKNPQLEYLCYWGELDLFVEEHWTNTPWRSQYLLHQWVDGFETYMDLEIEPEPELES